MFIHTPEYYYIYKNIHKLLLSLNPHNLKKSGFPHIQTIRWNSLYHCVEYILKNDELKNSQNPKIQKYFNEIESKITWKNLENILKILNNFITIIEEDQTNLADLMNEFIFSYRQLSNGNSIESKFMAQCFYNRFWNDCHLYLPAFAYLLTKEGLLYIKESPENEKQMFIDFAINGLHDFIMKRKYTNFNEVFNLFINYLNDLPIEWFSDDLSPYEKWEKIPNDLGMIACEVLTIPCTEAAVERLYSYLSQITSSPMYNSSIEVIESRLMIHLDSLL